MNSKPLRSAVIIPSTVNDFYWALYKVALKATRSCDAILTVDIDRIENLIKEGALNRIIVIMGSKKVPNTFSVYKRLKKLDPKIKFTLMDSWTWRVRKKDKMILLPVQDTLKLIKDCLRD